MNCERNHEQLAPNSILNHPANSHLQVSAYLKNHFLNCTAWDHLSAYRVHQSAAPLPSQQAEDRQTFCGFTHTALAPSTRRSSPPSPWQRGRRNPRAVGIRALSSSGETSLGRADLGFTSAARGGRRHLGTSPLDACSAVSFFFLSQLLRIMHQHNMQGRGCPTGRAAGLQPAQGFRIPQETEGSSGNVGARGRA